MPHPASLKQSYDSACSHTPQQIVTGNKNTMSTSSTNVFGKRPTVTLISTRTLKKNLISVPNSKINFFKLSNTNSPLLSSCQKTVKCKANSIYFYINTMQCNKVVDSTSSKNSVSDTSKFQSFPISLYNVGNKDKSLPFLLSTTSKAFQCKETVVQVSTDNGQKNKSNSCEKKDSVVFTKPSSDMPSNLFTESILKGKRDVSTYKKFIFQSTTDAEKYEMIQNVFIPDKSFVFPKTQRLFLHRWFKLFPWLCYSLVEDGAYCLPCLLFARKKNTAAKSFILKPFKHWPDGMGAFKRHRS